MKTSLNPVKVWLTYKNGIKWMVIIITIGFTYNCSSEFSQFNKEALLYASNDKKISDDEYQKLRDRVKCSNERGFLTFKKDGNVDNEKLTSYLLKLYSAKKLGLTISDISQTESLSEKEYVFNINVFLENSASIDGYVGENSLFKTNIFKLLTDLKNFPSTNSLNLHYINTDMIPIKQSASRDDLDDFYQRLNPADFKRAGGTRASTDIEKMLKKILDETDSCNFSVFISDCVFSPGRTDANRYLAGQYAAIYNDFLSAKRTIPNLTIAIIQCKAKFEGTYFDYLDHPHENMSMERPYYIWFIGTFQQIHSITNQKIFELLKNGYSNKLTIKAINEIEIPEYKILYRPRVGDFNSNDLHKGIINDASTSEDDRTKGLFRFNVAVNYSKGLQDETFFLDSANYVISTSGYVFKPSKISDRSNPSIYGFTHVLSFQTTNLKTEIIKVDIIGKTPSWIYDSTSSDDTGIEHDTLEYHKTYGLKYLVEGVCDAFYSPYPSNTISSFSITINR